MVQIGDRIVVMGCQVPAYVESIVEDKETASIIINLDWKEYGKSRVRAHDENKIWYRYAQTN